MNKKSKKIRKIIIILIIFLMIFLTIFVAYNYLKKDTEKVLNEIKVVKSIEGYDYNLKENETDLYNDTFEELVNSLSVEDVSYEEYAKIISKLFIIDFYTLNNKLSKNDIGGTEFIHPDIVDNFIEEARSTFYKYIVANIGESKNSILPEVSSINEVLVAETKFILKEKKETVDAYKVSIKWSYKNESDYEKEANLILIRYDNKLYIVEMD